MKKIISLIAVVLLTSVTLSAKWWIFGKAKQPVKIKYVYVNNIAVNSFNKSLVIYKNSLINSMIVIRGKAKAAKGNIGSVRVTIDGKATWKDAKFSDDGAFEFKFKPETGKKYEVYIEVMDTSGKTNKVDDTKMILQVSDKNPFDEVRETLDNMIKAYNSENIKEFMKYVSEDFTGDKVLLEQAVRDDFNALSNIRLRYTINSISGGENGKIFVSIRYNRMVFVNKTGASNTDSGNTELVFKNENGKLKLYSMKKPLIFGLSDADNVATGVVVGESKGLTLDKSGSLSTVKTVSATKAVDGNDMISYNFAENMTYSETSIPGDDTKLVNGDIAFNEAHLIDSSVRNVQIAQVNGKSIDSLSLSDVQKLTYLDNQLFAVSDLTGMVFAVRVNGKYYAIEFVSFTGSTPPYTATFKVKSF